MAASFASTIGVLIPMQGVLYSVLIGFTIMYLAIIRMPNQGFMVKRSLALGVMQASTGVKRIAMHLVLATLLLHTAML